MNNPRPVNPLQRGGPMHGRGNTLPVTRSPGPSSPGPSSPGQGRAIHAHTNPQPHPRGNLPVKPQGPNPGSPGRALGPGPRPGPGFSPGQRGPHSPNPVRQNPPSPTPAQIQNECPDDYVEFDPSIEGSPITDSDPDLHPELQIDIKGEPNPFGPTPLTYEPPLEPSPDPVMTGLEGLFLGVVNDSFFGSEIDPLSTVVPSHPNEEVNVFYEPESEANIQYDGDTLKGGSFTQLIAKLTTMPSPIDMDDFLLTYRSYSNPAQLLDNLIQRFNTAQASDRNVVQLRTFTVLGKWISDYWYDFETDDYCLQTTNVFLDKVMKSEDRVAVRVSTDVYKKLQKKVKQLTSHLIAHEKDVPSPLLQGIKDINSTSLLEHNEMELARQITLKTWEMWGHIKPWELLNLAWTKKEKETKAKNVLDMTTFFNYLSGWVTTTVITPQNIRVRVACFKKFVKLAHCLRQLGNFNALMAVWSGLQRQPVFRLAKTSAEAFKDKEIVQIHAELSQITKHDKSYAEMRRVIRDDTNPPVIPYLGMYLTDLVFTEEGNPKKLAGTALINYGKCRLVAGTVRKIQNYQQMGYNFKRIGHIQIRLDHLTVIQDEKDMDDISKFNEPKEGNAQPPEPKSFQDFKDKCNEARQRMLKKQEELNKSKQINNLLPKPGPGRGGTGAPGPAGRGRGTNVPAPPQGGSELLTQRTQRSDTRDVEIKLDATEDKYPFSPIVPDTIVNFHSEGSSIVYATLPKLVDHLTQHAVDTKVLTAITSKACTVISNDEFLNTLVLRYTVPPPVDPAVHGEWLVKHRNPIATRVVNLLKHWLKQSWAVFEADPYLKESLIAFTSSLLPSPETTRLQEMIKAGRPITSSPFFTLKPPTLLSHNPGPKNALSWDDADLVSSLTLDALHTVSSHITNEMLLTPKNEPNFLEAMDWSSVVKQIQDPKTGFPCKERRKLMKSYPKTVLGSEVTEWFCAKPYSLSKPHSIIVGRHLHKIGIIVSLDRTTEFEANDIFHFCGPEAITEVLLSQNVQKCFDFKPNASDSPLESLVKSHLLTLQTFVFNELQAVSHNVRDVVALTKRWVSIAMSLEEHQNFHSQMGVVGGLLQAYRKVTHDNRALLDKIWDKESTAWLRNRRNFFSSELDVRDHFSRTMCSPAVPMFHIFYNWARANMALGDQKMSPALINIKRISADYEILELFERAHATPFDISPNLQVLAYLGSSFTG